MQICMNWSKLAFDWNQARALVAVADLGSLSAAGKALGLTQPTVRRPSGWCWWSAAVEHSC